MMASGGIVMEGTGVITLLTDFGLDDEYVGVMKGVILSINRKIPIVDITHRVRRHDVVQAALLLDSSFGYFPPGSIHVVVVDPGVGGKRKIICLEAEGHCFLAPDNGVLEFILDRDKIDRIHAVTEMSYFLRSVGSTFHGRDIFAPVAAHLADGLGMASLGEPLTREKLVRIDFPQARLLPDGKMVGCVVLVDRFGNLITNIDRDTLTAFTGDQGMTDVKIRVGQLRIKGVSAAYDAVPVGRPVAVIGSKNRLEISMNQADASAWMKDEKEKVILTLK